jgi:hypothetical protein
MEFTLTLTGSRPLIMHSVRLADPSDPIVKQIKKLTSKRTKTEDDQEDIAHLEFLGCLYHDADAGPFLPGENVQRCLLDAARINRLGKQIERGVFIDSDINPIAYKGPREPEKLWADMNFRHRAAVRVTTSRTMRCRPMFQQWRAEVHGLLDTALLSLEDLSSIAANAGAMVGIGDRRPRFGRFTAEVTTA